VKIHHIRNATCVIESGEYFILVDPMLADKGELAPFSYVRFTRKRNPTVSLPENAFAILDKTSHCLMTHSQKLGIRAFQHTDHLDRKGEAFLRQHKIPVIALEKEKSHMRRVGLNLVTSLKYWQPQPMLGGRIIAIPARHGHGWIRHFMANGAGFYLELPDEPSIYISGDTVYTTEVERVLTELEPVIAIMACGRAELDIGGPILMSLPELIKFARAAPSYVIANHLEALNHCPVTRKELQDALGQNGLSNVIVPQDGETITINGEKADSRFCSSTSCGVTYPLAP
jgi:L-ascorbate metabolism protein UlaG (beta-lactamase superfamily)